MAKDYADRLTIAATFGAAGAVVSLIVGFFMFSEGGASAVALQMLLATLAATLSGFIFAKLVLRSTVSGAMIAGVLVPVLAQLVYSILLWVVNGIVGWNNDPFLTYVIAFFGIGLILMGCISLPVGIVIGLWLKKRLVGRAI